MKRLLRGVVDFGDGKLTQDQIAVSWERLVRSGIEWPNPDERKLFTFIKEYVQENHEPPNAAAIRDFFERLNELTVTEKLLDVKAVEVYTRTHYETLLKSLLEEQRGKRFAKLAGEASEIAIRGLVVGAGKNKRRLEGADAANDYLMERIQPLLERPGVAKTGGNLRADTGAGWEAYVAAKGGAT